MEDNHRAQIASVIAKVLVTGDLLDSIGFTQMLDEDGDVHMRDLMVRDLLSFLFYVVGESDIDEDCVGYINECLDTDYSLTDLNHMNTVADKKASVIVDSLLPYFMFFDYKVKQLEECISGIYLQGIAYLCMEYIQLESDDQLSHVVNLNRIYSGCKHMIEEIVGEEIDFDPMEQISAEQLEDVLEAFIELDKLCNADYESFGVIEAAIRKTIVDNGEKFDTDMLKYEIKSEDKKDEPEPKEDPKEIIKRESGYVEPFSCSALDELNRLVGLDSIKSEVQTILNVHQMQSRCEELGITREPISKHMVFAGNPGTGKTTVARLVGQIYKEAGILSKGDLIEVSRAELVGKYIGHTAAQVKEAFARAKGGVLFIDEAYALTDQGSSDYGQEAIDTMVKLMEDDRADIAVIVAGYSGLMHEFLYANPGLKSRFASVIEFPDYTGSEMVKIFKMFCEKNQISVTPDVKTAVRQHFEYKAKKKSGSNGNGRDVRNYFEKMLQNQANRLAKSGVINEQTLTRFTIEDIPKDGILKAAQVSV